MSALVFFANLFLLSPSLLAIVIVLDPGHGGKDPGYHNQIQSDSKEKDINLAVAKRLGKVLQTEISALKIIYTRQSDVFVSLNKRVEIANQHLADLFISIHCNSSSNQQASGLRIHLHNKQLKKDRQLAEYIYKSLKQSTKRKILDLQDAFDRQQNFQIIQYTEMPSLLIELGFLSNRHERDFLQTSVGQQQLVKAIALGIKNFLAKHRLVPTDRYQLYKIQLAAFKTLPDLSQEQREKILNMRLETYAKIGESIQFQHLVGHYHSYEEARYNLKKIQKVGFKSAFIVRVR